MIFHNPVVVFGLWLCRSSSHFFSGFEVGGGNFYTNGPNTSMFSNPIAVIVIKFI